ncbi:hypothetical protein G7K_5092-t1 [Saitoella complicata NRRL Y-17804]|uniref:Uncharacterized protein n=1 Tax=Saitoella complicata (strain BCRC 22490 / CBS 7301 / JCM 7358 / NBRC 10748 / NRRL Y-17804) TaxID=698492 RepID=A0A0E9NMS4_SAICN|nr:hypothetical protein G7K_5092-t1 [Saitoella complicata NRRL Y-17804]
MGRHQLEPVRSATASVRLEKVYLAPAPSKSAPTSVTLVSWRKPDLDLPCVSCKHRYSHLSDATRERGHYKSSCKLDLYSCCTAAVTIDIVLRLRHALVDSPANSHKDSWSFNLEHCSIRPSTSNSKHNKLPAPYARSQYTHDSRSPEVKPTSASVFTLITSSRSLSFNHAGGVHEVSELGIGCVKIYSVFGPGPRDTTCRHKDLGSTDIILYRHTLPSSSTAGTKGERICDFHLDAIEIVLLNLEPRIHPAHSRVAVTVQHSASVSAHQLLPATALYTN